jgi:hypothetical protein
MVEMVIVVYIEMGPGRRGWGRPNRPLMGAFSAPDFSFQKCIEGREIIEWREVVIS